MNSKMGVCDASPFAFLVFLPSLPTKARFNQNTFLVELVGPIYFI